MMKIAPVNVLAAVHVSPNVTVPVLVVCGLLLAAYWYRLGHPEVPVSRRHIRRLSVALMVISLPVFAKGLSFVDRGIDPRGYIIAWTVACGFIIAVVVTAFMDMINNMRLYRIERTTQLHDAAIDLASAMRKAREANTETSSSATGEDEST
jgi:hypothetical protein